jgi:ABC-type transport system involved in cytochrome bd biosynthesis fused ATPase/permease subunit
MVEDDKYKVPDASAGDAAHALAKGAAGVVPYAGGFLAELLQMVVAPPLEKRKAEWMNSVADGLKKWSRR